MNICDICDREFTFQKNLKRHKQNIHNVSTQQRTTSKDINKYIKKCPVCQLEFVGISSLRRHERIKHKMNITPYLKKRMKSKCITFETTNLEDYPLLQKLVPDDYVYKVNSIEDLKNEHIRAKFEISDCDKDMFLVWLSKLEQKSKVTYRVKSCNKSPSSKIVFNKVYRCMHNTFPSKYCIPHPKHTGCPATLSVRIKECSEVLSVTNTMADNNFILIPIKAIVTLYHCHNHAFIECLKEHQKVRNKTEDCEKFINHHNRENNLNHMHFGEFNNSTSSPSLVISDKNKKNQKRKKEIITEEVKLYEFKNNTFIKNDNIQKTTVGNHKFELSEELDNYIIVENVNTRSSLHYNNTNNCEPHQLLLDFDSVNEKMLQQFQSNPKYFMPAIKSYILAMKNKLTSKESLFSALNSFGKHNKKNDGK